MMIGAMFLFAAADAIAKLLTSSFHPLQIIWFRQIGLLLGVFVLLIMHGPSLMRTSQLGLQIFRGVLAVGSALLFVYAIRYAPLADAVAASFVAPFFVTILGSILLKEKVGVKRWSAVVVGFIGALIITRPGLGVIHPAVLLVVLAAGMYAARQVIGRLIADTDKTTTTVAYTAITASLITSIAIPLIWVTPISLYHWSLLIIMALVAGVGEVMIIRALEMSEASVVAPIHYTIIVWASLYGFFLFGHLPDQWTILGTAIIVLAGLYTLQRGKKANQKS